MKRSMQKIILSALVVVTVFAGQSVVAQEGPKVAVLDMATALFNSDKAQEVDAAVRAETAEDQEKVRVLAEEAQGLQTRLQQDAAVLSEADQRKITEDIQELGVRYQFLVQKIETLVEERRQQFQQTYAPNLIQAISDVVEEEGYDIVLRAEAALHYRTSFDITSKVTAKLNQ